MADRMGLKTLFELGLAVGASAGGPTLIVSPCGSELPRAATT